MPIEYACIAYGGVLLVEDKPVPHSFSPVVKKLIENAARHDTRASYQYEGSMYSTQVENEILYIVVTDTGLKTLTCFSFIGDVQHKFKAAMTGNPNTYPKPLELTPTRCASFANTLQGLVKLYSDNPDHNNKMVKLKGDIEVVKAQMLDNIDAIIKRGGDIENIVDKTQMLEEDAVRFERRATKLSSMMFWRNVKIVIAIILTVLVLCFFISMIVCGATYKKCKSDPPPPPPPTPSPPETPSPPTNKGSESNPNQGSGSTTADTPVPTPQPPPTPEPPSPAPPTPEPPTPEPPTPAPPTPAPPTPAPPTPAPPTPLPPTPEPPTPEPVTPDPGTPAPVTPAPVTPAPTPEPPTPAPATPQP